MSLPGTDLHGLSIISCVECRNRKIRCSRHLPQCNGCVKRQHSCVYPSTQRKTSTKLIRKHKGDNTRFYGFSSVNKALFEAGMPFCNVDYELETKHAPKKTKRINTSQMYTKYIKNPEITLMAIESMISSISYSIFGEIVDLDELKLALLSNQVVTYQTVSLCYAVVIVSERFLTVSHIEDLLTELNAILDDTPDCPQKVSSLILLADYYHFNFKIESAWRCTFIATSIAYALGLHVKSSKVWGMLVLHDALLCAVLSRPSSIKHADPKSLCRVSSVWGEISLLLRECNEVSLSLQSSRSIEKVVSLDIRCDELIERTRKDVKKCTAANKTDETFLGYLKLCILTANRIKLLFPIYPEYKALKVQLDENCSELANSLQGTIELLKQSGLASNLNPYPLRSHCFFAYCSMFQGFLFHFLFASTDAGDGPLRIGSENFEISAAEFARHSESPPSLSSVSILLQKYDSVSESVSFCVYMSDVFDSFRALLNQKTIQREQRQNSKLANDSSSNSSENTPASSNYRESEKNLVALPMMPEELPDWLTTCFSEGLFE